MRGARMKTIGRSRSRPLAAKVPTASKLSRWAPVAVALDGHVDGGERFLRGADDLGGQQDQPGAGAEHRAARVDEGAQRLPEAEGVHQLDQGGAFASGEDEAPDGVELLRLLDDGGVGAGGGECAPVRGEVPLETEDPYRPPLPRIFRFPRPVRGRFPPRCRRVPVRLPPARLQQLPVFQRADLDTGHRLAQLLGDPRHHLGVEVVGSSPRRSHFARLGGSLDLKTPEPTKIASAPSCIISDASRRG